ncbi:Mis6 domain protein [Aspergillus steynii IBT 23096]|uniref:Mis6 domain protein n=1 Tax=Aspergillus steynii IBT 23096 TaxID=1392250 RepID=A0A2I2G966_9EURO|nr:Mis6 domain protein [Aspergillus steynii IBT 23096]PLB49420.1 Mis6 domain protein [Aspergillus steynii IBT 23096]
MSSEPDRDTERRPHSLQDATKHLEAVAFVPSKQRYTDAGELGKIIASHAYESGIPSGTLERLIKTLTARSQLDQGTITTLIKNLYPSERVPSKIVTQVVCCLGPSKTKPAPATQALLLRWLILVHDFLDEKAHLSKLYAVLFNYLDMISLRKPLCHLLSLVTRRKHVKPFRIQSLMELVANSGGDEKELVTLLKTFKNYCPDVIVGDLGVSGRKMLYFKHPDPEWSGHVRHLHDTNLERTQAVQPSTFQAVHRGLTKRSKLEVIVPVVQTSRVSYNHTSLEELRDVGHFVEKLDKIELPNQIISTLGDSMAQKYIFLAQPEAAIRRLDDWLNAFLVDKMESAQDDEDDDDENESLGYVLSLLVDYVRYTKEMSPTITSFLKTYLGFWKGRDHREQVFALLEYLPVGEYDSIRTEFLTRLEAAVLHNMPPSQSHLLGFYTSLIRQWGVDLRARPFSLEESKPLTRLISHAELLALSVLECPPTLPQPKSTGEESSKPITLSVLELYCVLGELFSHAALNGSIRLTIPLAPTVYSLVLTPISSVISIFSSVLANYKSSFEASLTSKALQTPSSTDSLYPTQLVGQFNGYIMDICNLVWRNRGFNLDDPNALGCLMPAPTTNALAKYIREVNDASKERNPETAFVYNVGSASSLGHHVALCNMSAACFSDIEENSVSEDQPRLNRPVTQKALSALEKDGGIKISWQEYRIKMLDWLDTTGSAGIGNLMRSTMKALRKD